MFTAKDVAEISGGLNTQGPHYRVTDSQTGFVIGTYSTLKRASRKADKLDLEYGAHRYSVQRIDA